ncbi:MAG: ABC transporter permease [Candidatus Bathyarchaeia archaeon]|jgi:putative ABC transport system permease protein
MRVNDLLKLAVKALLDRKARSAMTVIGIMIGSAVIMALIASSSGLSVGIKAQVEKIGANVLIVRAGGSNFLSGSSSSFALSIQDIPRLGNLPYVTQVYPYYSRPATVSVGGQSVSGTLIGIDSRALPVIFKGLALEEGQFPDSYESTSAAIGYNIAYPTSGQGLVGLNQVVSMKIGSSSSSLSFLVKGILAAYGSALFSNVDNNIFVSLQAAQILMKIQNFSAIYVIVDSADNVATVQSEIQGMYGTDISVISAGSIASSISAITGQLTIFLGSIGAVSLFVAAIMVANTTYVAVMERTREIGILKALGFRRDQILAMFLSENIIIGLIGGLLGTAAGYILSFVIGGGLFGGGGGGFGAGGGARGASSTSFASSPVFSPELILFSLFFPVVIAIVAGLYPAWRASKMNVINALKYE